MSPKFVQRKNRTINESIKQSPLEWRHYQYENRKIRNHPIIFVVLYFIEHNANKYFNICVKKAWLLKITYWSLCSNIICRLLFPGHFVYMKTVEYNIYSLIFTFQYDTRRRAKKSTQSKHDVILQLKNSSQ